MLFLICTRRYLKLSILSIGCLQMESWTLLRYPVGLESIQIQTQFHFLNLISFRILHKPGGRHPLLSLISHWGVSWKSKWLRHLSTSKSCKSSCSYQTHDVIAIVCMGRRMALFTGRLKRWPFRGRNRLKRLSLCLRRTGNITTWENKIQRSMGILESATFHFFWLKSCALFRPTSMCGIKTWPLHFWGQSNESQKHKVFLSVWRVCSIFLSFLAVCFSCRWMEGWLFQ